MERPAIKEQLGSLCRVMAAEAGEYQTLLALLNKQRQAAGEARFERFVDAVGKKDALLKSLQHLEAERLQLMEALSGTFQVPPAELTVSRLIAMMPGPETEQLNACRYQLRAVLGQVRANNKTNQELLRHLRDLMKKSVDVLGGKLPGEETYRENGRVQTTRTAGAALHGHISFEV